MIRTIYVVECDNCGVDATDKNKGHLISETRRDGWFVDSTTNQALCPECNLDQLTTRGG